MKNYTYKQQLKKTPVPDSLSETILQNEETK
ncbi:hypothetical protein ES705_38993 [subsurface metagenome]